MKMRKVPIGVLLGSDSDDEMGEDVDPATSLINLADLMLVLAIGILLALVAYWNIDLGPQVSELSPEKDMTEVTNMEDIQDILAARGSGYTEVGTVYTDPETGKFYILTEDAALAGGAGESNATNSEAAADTP